MKVDADDFLNRVILNGKFKESFYNIDEKNLDINKQNSLIIYEYEMDNKLYEIVIHKKDNKYINYYMKVI